LKTAKYVDFFSSVFVGQFIYWKPIRISI